MSILWDLYHEQDRIGDEVEGLLCQRDCLWLDIEAGIDSPLNALPIEVRLGLARLRLRAIDNRLRPYWDAQDRAEEAADRHNDSMANPY